jgi:hypothetical protein
VPELGDWSEFKAAARLRRRTVLPNILRQLWWKPATGPTQPFVAHKEPGHLARELFQRYGAATVFFRSLCFRNPGHHWTFGWRAAHALERIRIFQSDGRGSLGDNDFHRRVPVRRLLETSAALPENRGHSHSGPRDPGSVFFRWRR